MERTPLLVSASKGRSTAVDYLLELGADIHAIDGVSYIIFIHCYACILIKNIFVNVKNIQITSFNIRFSPIKTYFNWSIEIHFNKTPDI